VFPRKSPEGGCCFFRKGRLRRSCVVGVGPPHPPPKNPPPTPPPPPPPNKRRSAVWVHRFERSAKKNARQALQKKGLLFVTLRESVVVQERGGRRKTFSRP